MKTQTVLNRKHLYSHCNDSSKNNQICYIDHDHINQWFYQFMTFLVLSCNTYRPGKLVFNFLFPHWGLKMVLNGKFRCRSPAPQLVEGVWFPSSGSIISPVQCETTVNRLLTATLLSRVHRNLPRCLSPRKWEGKINVIIYLYCQKTHYKHTPQITKQSKDRERELNSNRETHVQFSAVYAPISVCSTNQHTYTLVWSYFLVKSAFL